jgi:hypothetical protein
MNRLEDFFDAYDKTHDLSGGAPEWKHLRRRVRRALARPVLELAGQVAFLIACLIFGIMADPIGYVLAVGTLCHIPQYVRRVRKEITGIAELSSNEELRKHLQEEAQVRMAGAFTSALFWAGFALLFVLTGGIAALLGKDFRPGLGAGLIAGALSAYSFLFCFLRASRECRALDDEEVCEEGDIQEAEGGN